MQYSKLNLAFIFLAFLTSQSLGAQNMDSVPFDEAYLNSLPEDMRLDLLNQIDEQDQAKEDAGKRPSSQMSKKYKDKEIKDYIDYLEDKYNLPISDFESKRFGVDLFNSMQTSFMPLNEPNVDADYVIDFGDTLEVQVLGPKSYTEKVEVKRDGSISLKELGRVYVGGLSLGRADNLIQAKMSSAFVGREAFTSILSVRDIQVYIMGEAVNPGLYTLNGNSNALNALYMAAGILESGSFRNILLKRDGKTLINIDLYDLFINGNTNSQMRLRSGDVILIPSHNNIASIYGGVKRPFEYELKDSETLFDLIKFANGFSEDATKENIRLIRGDGSLVIISQDEIEKVNIENRDSIFVDSNLYKTISVDGAVLFPGSYTVNMDAKLSDVIKKAGGYRDDAYPLGGVLENTSAGNLSYFAAELSHKKLIENFFANGITVTAGLAPVLEELKQVPSNRIVATFDLDLIEEDPSKDTYLESGDSIFIPVKTQQIYVFGAVNSPGATRHIKASSINDYIDEKGGFSKAASKDLIFVINPNGESSLYTQKKIFGLGYVGGVIPPGSTIFVTPKMNMTAVQASSIWAPVVSSLALSVASINSLGN